MSARTPRRSGSTNAAVCLLTGVLAGCGSDGPSSPTQPSGRTAPVPPGRALLTISSQDPECGAKSPVWGFLGPRAMASATVAADGEGWVARADSARVGDFEIRYRLTGSGSLSQVLITGTIRGTAIDLLSSLQFPNPTRVGVSGASGPEAALDGTSFPVGGIAGTVTGNLTYTDNQGSVTTCRSGMLNLFAVDR